MCAPVAMAGLQIAGTVMGQKEGEQNAAAARQAAIHGMNISFQNYEMERQDAFDSAVQEIMKTRMNADELNAGVDAAVNEDMAGGGRTADLLKRNVRGDAARAISSIQENYGRKSDEIDINKEGTLISTKAKVDSIQAPSRVAAALQIAGIGLSTKAYLDNAQAQAMAKGVSKDDWNYWSASAKAVKPDPLVYVAGKGWYPRTNMPK